VWKIRPTQRRYEAKCNKLFKIRVAAAGREENTAKLELMKLLQLHSFRKEIKRITTFINAFCGTMTVSSIKNWFFALSSTSRSNSPPSRKHKNALENSATKQE
jgi:hypothetical protein